MARIITNQKFNDVTCEVCGAVYAFEPGIDDVNIVYSEFSGYKMYVKCPICGKCNELKKEIIK